MVWSKWLSDENIWSFWVFLIKDEKIYEVVWTWKLTRWILCLPQEPLIPASGIHFKMRKILTPSNSVKGESDNSDQILSTFQNTVETVKNELNTAVQILKEEQRKTDKLKVKLVEMNDQWNDLTELHQNEMYSMKVCMLKKNIKMQDVKHRKGCQMYCQLYSCVKEVQSCESKIVFKFSTMPAC